MLFRKQFSDFKDLLKALWFLTPLHTEHCTKLSQQLNQSTSHPERNYRQYTFPHFSTFPGVLLAFFLSAPQTAVQRWAPQNGSQVARKGRRGGQLGSQPPSRLSGKEGQPGARGTCPGSSRLFSKNKTKNLGSLGDERGKACELLGK